MKRTEIGKGGQDWEGGSGAMTLQRNNKEAAEQRGFMLSDSGNRLWNDFYIIRD